MFVHNTFETKFRKRRFNPSNLFIHLVHILLSKNGEFKANYQIPDLGKILQNSKFFQ